MLVRESTLGVNQNYQRTISRPQTYHPARHLVFRVASLVLKPTEWSETLPVERPVGAQVDVPILRVALCSKFLGWNVYQTHFCVVARWPQWRSLVVDRDIAGRASGGHTPLLVLILGAPLMSMTELPAEYSVLNVLSMEFDPTGGTCWMASVAPTVEDPWMSPHRLFPARLLVDLSSFSFGLRLFLALHLQLSEAGFVTPSLHVRCGRLLRFSPFPHTCLSIFHNVPGCNHTTAFSSHPYRPVRRLRSGSSTAHEPLVHNESSQMPKVEFDPTSLGPSSSSERPHRGLYSSQQP